VDEQTAVKQKPQLDDYRAAERTFLTWVQTSLALMGFGFLVARFGLFVEQIEISQGTLGESSSGLSLWFGTALIVGGVIVLLSSALSFVRLVRELDRGVAGLYHSLTYSVSVASFLALVGVAMSIYLVSVHSTSSVHAEERETTMTSLPNKGIVDKPSNHSVDETVERLKNILQAKGVMLFAIVDHSGEAAKVGIKMRPTKLLIFGSPKAGTPLMLAAPSIAIDLPLKILVWEDPVGKVWLSYNSSEYLAQRHGLPQDLMPNIAVVEALAVKAGE
jgi:uncharacterized protein (DUF302 family)/uncharacterized membrane protein YidH (DUF202 family)